MVINVIAIIGSILCILAYSLMATVVYWQITADEDRGLHLGARIAAVFWPISILCFCVYCLICWIKE